MKKERTYLKVDCYNLTIKDIEELVRKKYDVGENWELLDVNLSSHDCRFQGKPWNLEVAFEKQRTIEL